jgi:hypothetical protein
MLLIDRKCPACAGRRAVCLKYRRHFGADTREILAGTEPHHCTAFAAGSFRPWKSKKLPVQKRTLRAAGDAGAAKLGSHKRLEIVRTSSPRAMVDWLND